MISKEFIAEAKPHVFWGRLDIANQNYIIDLAKTKPDGIFKARGIMFRVKDQKVTHFAAVQPSYPFDIEIIQGAGHFNVVLQTIKDLPPSLAFAKARKILKAIQ